MAPSSRAAAALVATASVASATLNVTLLARVQNPKTWFGDTAVSMQGPDDPVLLLSSWVFKPSLVEAFRPAQPGHNASSPIWSTNVSGNYTYETLYVTSAVPFGGHGGPAPPAVDTLLLWSFKPPQPPGMLVGPLVLYGIDSGCTAVNLSGNSGFVWKTELSSTAVNVNLWSPLTWFALSDDGQVAVAWIFDGSAKFSVWCLDGQTGKVAWHNTIAYNASVADYAYSSGVTLSGDGKWVIYDTGLAGTTNQSLIVVDSATGRPRAQDPVQSVGIIDGVLSHDGSFTIANLDPTAPELTVFQWSQGAGAYTALGSVTGPNPSGSTGGGAGWYLVGSDFGFDPASGRTIVGAVWVTADLVGTYAIGVWDVAKLAAGPIAAFNYTSVQSKFAVDEAAISCAGLLCAVAMNTPVVDGTLPTTIILSAEGDGAAWSTATPGSMLSVDVNVGTDAASGARTYYVGLAGCTTPGVCTKPGADAYLYRVSGAL